MVKQKNQHQSLGYASQNTQKMFRLILLSSNCYHESLLYLIKLQSNTFLLSNRGRWQNVAQSFNSISLNFFFKYLSLPDSLRFCFLFGKTVDMYEDSALKLPGTSHFLFRSTVLLLTSILLLQRGLLYLEFSA